MTRSEGERRKKHRPARVGTTREASLTDTKSCPVHTASQYNMNTYPICDYPLWKSAHKQKLRRNHHFYVWIEALTNSKPLECEDSFTNQQHSNFLLYCRRQKGVKQPHLNPWKIVQIAVATKLSQERKSLTAVNREFRKLRRRQKKLHWKNAFVFFQTLYVYRVHLASVILWKVVNFPRAEFLRLLPSFKMEKKIPFCLFTRSI